MGGILGGGRAGAAGGGMGGMMNPPAPKGFDGGFINFRDMFDGGGAGGSGDRFQGAPISALLNAFGVRPMGYNQRQGLLDVASSGPAPAARPAPAPRALPTPAAADTGIETTVLPPPGARPNDELIAMVRGAIDKGQSAPRMPQDPPGAPRMGGMDNKVALPPDVGAAPAAPDPLNSVGAAVAKARVMVPQFDMLSTDLQNGIIRHIMSGGGTITIPRGR